jgi:ribosomal protein L11 methyltransferase
VSRTATAGSWLELAVEADAEAVEAVSEIIGRVATGGTTVEPAFDLVEEGLGARVDPTRPAVVRGYVEAGAAAERAAAEVAEALGHLQAFGLRPIGELRTRTVREADWAEAWKAYFPVMRVGRRLVIRPTWRDHTASPDDVVLALDPGMAFGTGLHPTTRLCLAALEPLADEGQLDGVRVLDVGCGSGILAIAAARLGVPRVDAIDVDPDAVAATEENARQNGVADRVRASVAAADAWPGPPAALVFANLLGAAHLTLAPALTALTAPGGALIAGGLLVHEVPAVAGAFAAAGCWLAEVAEQEGWATLLLRRGG